MAHTMTAPKPNTDARLSALETDMHSLKGMVGDMVAKLDRMSSTDWKALSAWATVIITIMSGAVVAVWSMATMKTEHVNEIADLKIAAVAKKVDEHQADGHPHTNTSRIERLDATVREKFAEVETQNRGLEREMVLRDSRDHDATKLRDMLNRYRAVYGDLPGVNSVDAATREEPDQNNHHKMMQNHARESK